MYSKPLAVICISPNSYSFKNHNTIMAKRHEFCLPVTLEKQSKQKVMTDKGFFIFINTKHTKTSESDKIFSSLFLKNCKTFLGN